MGIFVEAYSQGDVSDLFQKVLDTGEGVAGAGTLPNIFAAYTDSAYVIYTKGSLVSLDTYMTSEEMDHYHPFLWEEGYTDGKPYIFPIAKSTELLYMDGNG